MTEIIQNFQFIRPLWLWLFVPILVGYVLKLKYGKDQNIWQQIIPQHLYQQMIVSKGIHKSNSFMHVVMLGLLIATLAIAGPSWEKLPQAVYQSQVGKVILMDMSMSLRATDLSPDRLTRARFKAIDLVNEVKEGETGLVAYSGDAFVVSPLTDDINNLKSLIPVLSPEIMPTQGSDAIIGLTQAASLLENAGYKQGQIYWITDGINVDEIKDVRNFIINSPFDISALLIGTEAGAPITMQDGQLLKDFSGKIVIPSINARYMDQAMSGTGAQFHQFETDNSDIQAIKRKVEFEQQQQAEAVENTSGDELKDMGPFLVLLLLPIAAYSFRKGLLNVAIVGLLTAVLLVPNKPVLAQSKDLSGTPAATPETLASPNSPAESLLDKVFKNADQRGKQAFDNSDFEKAGELFENNEWRAASAYKKGDYESASALYGELLSNDNTNTTSNYYNQGNALAKQGKLEEAIESYDQALLLNKKHEQTIQNKKIVEDMLKQQQSDPDKQKDSKEKSSEQNKDQEEQENKDQQKGEEDQQEQQSQDSEGKDSEQQSEKNSEQQSEDQQDNQQQSDQQSDQQENTNDEALKQKAQEQAEQDPQSEQQKEQEKAQQNKANEPTDDKEPTEQEQQAAISNQINADDLTPEQKEEMQRMQMILNKVPDDPAYLLKRKMLLEAYKRKNNPPPSEQENW